MVCFLNRGINQLHAFLQESAQREQLGLVDGGLNTCQPSERVLVRRAGLGNAANVGNCREQLQQYRWLQSWGWSDSINLGLKSLTKNHMFTNIHILIFF